MRNKLQLRPYSARAALNTLANFLVWGFVLIGMVATYNYTTSHFPTTTAWIGTVYRVDLFCVAFWLLIVRPFREGFFTAKGIGRTSENTKQANAQQDAPFNGG